MFPSKGGGGCGGQRPFAAQQGYEQLSGLGYSGNPGTGSDIGGQHPMASRQASMMSITQEQDVPGYRTHATQGALYGGPYASVYGSEGSGQQYEETRYIECYGGIYNLRRDWFLEDPGSSQGIQEQGGSAHLWKVLGLLMKRTNQLDLKKKVHLYEEIRH